MSRLIVGCPKGLFADHINHDTLDNRRENLRITTNKQNCANHVMAAHNTTGYRGVTWNARLNKYIAQIRRDGDTKHIGCFIDPQKASEAYEAVAKEVFGEFYYPLTA